MAWLWKTVAAPGMSCSLLHRVIGQCLSSLMCRLSPHRGPRLLMTAAAMSFIGLWWRSDHMQAFVAAYQE